MKYSIFLLLMMGIFLGSTFAQQLTLEASTTQIDINQAFGLTVTVSNLENPASVEIVGMQPFKVHSQSTANNTVLINGVMSSQVQLHLQVQANTTGSFVIGPARIQVASGVVDSNTITVEVIGDKLFVNPQSIVDLSGVTVPEVSAEPELPTKSRWKYVSGFLILLVLLGGILLKGYRKLTGVVQKKKVPQSLGPVQLPRLPRANAAHFRDEMDGWMRHRFVTKGIDKAEGMTGQELIQIAKSSFDDMVVEYVICLVNALEQAKYAGSEPDRQEVLQQAKKLFILVSLSK